MRAVDDAQREGAGRDGEIVAVDKEVRRQRDMSAACPYDNKDPAAALAGSETIFKSMRYHCRIRLSRRALRTRLILIEASSSDFVSMDLASPDRPV
jgi:hypothetical protein